MLQCYQIDWRLNRCCDGQAYRSRYRGWCGKDHQLGPSLKKVQHDLVVFDMLFSVGYDVFTSITPFKTVLVRLQMHRVPCPKRYSHIAHASECRVLEELVHAWVSEGNVVGGEDDQGLAASSDYVTNWRSLNVVSPWVQASPWMVQLREHTLVAGFTHCPCCYDSFAGSPVVIVPAEIALAFSFMDKDGEYICAQCG